MIAISVDKMRELERIAIENLNIPSVLLMENAAYGFVSALKQEIADLNQKKVCIVCGKGNNGGDGYAIARLLHLSGAKVTILPVCDIATLSGDAKTNCEIAKTMRIPFVTKLSECDIIVDAIFGTGFHGSVSSDIEKIINNINKSNSYVASVDIMSGLSANDGQGSIFVRADLCISFGYAKYGLFFHPAKGAYKKLITVPISIPECNDGCEIITKKTFDEIPKRQPDSHKGTFGKALAFVGSYGMAGAAILSGSAILKSGAGMATVATADNLIPSLAHHFPSVMTCPIPTVDGDFSDDAAELILKKSQGMDALLIGCGLGQSEKTKKTVISILKNVKIPTVIDADALNILAENIDILKEKCADFILTPHILEFSRLSGYEVSEIKKNPYYLAKEFSTKYGVTLILKDSVTVIADKDGKTAINVSENSGMATAGSGDVLAGIATSLLSQSIAPFEAAKLAVYIHSSAGRLAVDSLGEYGMTSSDILENVPSAFVEPCDITPFIKEL